MSPILDMQRRLHEAGRIRIGEQVATSNGKTRPKKLDTFRLTSSSEAAIIGAAQLYGGDPTPWSGAPVGKQWELLTESAELNVMVPPENMSFSQYMELWSGGGCKRRCDGKRLIPSDEPCVCDSENPECRPHTRLSVMLTGLAGTGLWRLDTQGHNAAIEIGGAFELALLISRASGQALLPGRLRLDQREAKRPGEPTRQFAVPVLDFDVDLTSLSSGVPRQQAIDSRVTPVPALPAPPLAEQLAEVERDREPRPRRNAAEPIRPTGVKPRTLQQATDAVAHDAEAAEIAVSDDVASMSLREVTEALQVEGLPLTGNLAAKRQRLAEHRASLPQVAPADERGIPRPGEEPFPDYAPDDPSRPFIEEEFRDRYEPEGNED